MTGKFCGFFLFCFVFFKNILCAAFKHQKYATQIEKHTEVQTPFKFPCLVLVNWMHPKITLENIGHV